MNIEEITRGDLSLYRTKDGSVSLHSSCFNESFHCTGGALKEAREKFLLPAQLDRFSPDKKISVLDVCFGMGYNTACIIESLIKNSIEFDWWGLEVDKRPLKIGLNNLDFQSLWDIDVYRILYSLQKKGCWKNKSSEGRILWGDAREKLLEIPASRTFDLILLDAFSPVKCPVLWTQEFLCNLTSKLGTEGRLITYCTAAAIRKSMRTSGLMLVSRSPKDNHRRSWSDGTIGVRNNNELTNIKNLSNWNSLSLMEEEHLSTKAAVPYRDPTGLSTKIMILDRRQKEQRNSKMEATRNWRRRWGQTEQS